MDTYLLYSTRRDNYQDSWQAQRILGAANYYHGQPILFMSIYPMTSVQRQALQGEGFQVDPLKAFVGAEEFAEDRYFYRLTLKNSAPAS